MSRPDDVFAMFVDANPVLDVAALESGPDLLPDLERGGPNMRNATDLGAETSAGARTSSRAPWSGPWYFVAAAALVVVLVGGVWLFGDRSSIDVTDTDVPIEERAVAAVEQHWDAVDRGDIDTVIGLAYDENTADTRMWEFNAVLAEAGHPTVVEGCDVVYATENLAEVRCAVTVDSPVFEALDDTEGVAPFTFIDGTLAWKPFEDLDFPAANAAFAVYLQANRADDYERACSPLAYDPAEIVQNQGIALTAECAALEVEVMAEVARWIRDGMPEG